MKKINKDLTTGSIAAKLSGLTIPMMLGIISMVAFNLVDTYFVGRLGSMQLAALSFTFPVIMVIFSLVQGLGIGATALISKSIGKMDRQKAARETTDSLALSIVISGFFILIGLLTVEPTFRLLGASEEIIPYVSEYMTIWYFALFFVTIPFVGNSAIRATGDATTPSLIMLFAVLINAILDPILIFGWGPITAMGLKGAAIATAISRALTLVLSLYILGVREKLIITKIPSWSVLKGCWGAILYIGLPSGFSKMVAPLSAAVITALLAQYGDSAVAAYGVGTRIEFLATSVLFALSASIGPFTGQNLGAGHMDRIKKALFISNRFSVLWGFAVAGIIYFLSAPIASIFTSDAEVIANTQIFLSIVPLSFGFQGVVQNVSSCINTLSKPLLASWIIIIQMIIVGIPAFYLGHLFFGITGIFGGLAFTYVFGGLISIWFNSKVHKKFSNES